MEAMYFFQLSSVFYVALVLIVAAVTKKVIRALQDPLKHLPGPRTAAWSNIGLKKAVITGQRIHYVHNLHSKYGSIVRISPTEVSVSDPTSVAAIHKIGSGYIKSPWYIAVVNMLRPVLFSMNDPHAHARRRRMFARAFSMTYLRSTFESTVHSLIRESIGRMKAEAMAGPTDILKWWTFMATDVVALLMFGDSFHMIEKGEVNEYVRVLQAALKGGGIGVELPLMRTLLKPLPLKALKEVFCGNDYLMNCGLEARCISKRSQDDKSIFSFVNKEAEKEGGHLDETDVLLESQALLVAGSDTTAVSLTYLVWAVLSHPAWQQELEEEVSALQPDFNDADLEKLPVLSAIIEETLRLYGAAPGGLPRIVPEGGARMDDYYLPAGTTVSTQSYTLHRNVDLFPNPYKFEPLRWLPPTEQRPHNVPQVSNVAKAMYSPFGFGSRTCLGVHLAKIEMRLATAEFFRTLRGARLAASVTAESMEMENFFLIAPKAHRCEVTLTHSA